MGVDLNLLPLISKDYWAAHSILVLERRRGLWPLVEGLASKPIPQPLYGHYGRDANGETRYGTVDVDPYGSPLRYTTAGELMKIVEHESVQDNWLNQAVWAYLARMPMDWPIVLYWH